MQVEVTREMVGRAIDVAARFASGKNTSLPVLSGLLLIAQSGTLTIRATNLEAGIELTVPVKIKQEGSVVVPAALITGVMNTIASHEKLEIRASGQTVSIIAGKSVSTIATLPGDDFPTLPQSSSDTVFSLPTNVLLEGLQSVVFSASQSTIKPELGTVSITYRDGSLIFAATDSFRLAERVLNVSNLTRFPQVLVPQRTVAELTRLLSSLEGDIDVRLSQTQLSLETDTMYFTARLVDMPYPDYTSIIPKESVTKVTLLTQDVIQALKKVNLFSDTFNQVTLTVNDGSITFDSKHQGVGETREELAAVIKGEPISINFNHRYLSEGIQKVPTESVDLCFNGLGRPLVVRGTGNNSFTYLVMPMNR